MDVPVVHMKAEAMGFKKELDAVWACASLLHVPGTQQKNVLMLIGEALKPSGICYCSWKYGDEERTDNGRHFTDYTEQSLGGLLNSMGIFKVMNRWITDDVRINKDQKWINVIIKKIVKIVIQSDESRYDLLWERVENMDFRALMNTTEYDFLRTNERLGDRIMLLGLGGSYAYGTNNEGSDIDFRGVTLMLPSDLLGLTEFEQYEDDKTDTVIYGFNKLVKLLLECNPNICEMLGLDEEQYLIKSKLGQELVDNSGLFLSKRAIKSFGGYADAQLRRLQNAIARDTLPQTDREKHILKSVMNALDDFNRRYAGKENGSIRLYIDRAENPKLDTEIFVDADYKHFPLRDYTNLWGTMRTVVRDYDKIGKRNKKKDDNHLNKHAMHLIRLFMMAIDILEKGEIRTHRKDDLPILLAIRRGDYMLTDGTFSTEFYEMLEEYEYKLDEAAVRTVLPDNPDMEKVEAFVEHINRYAVTGE